VAERLAAAAGAAEHAAALEEQLLAQVLDRFATGQVRIDEGLQQDVEALVVGGLLQLAAAEVEVGEDLLALVQAEAGLLAQHPGDAIAGAVAAGALRLRRGGVAELVADTESHARVLGLPVGPRRTPAL